MDIDFAEDKYDHEEWLTFIKGLEKEPERGARCLKCFTFRLMRTAKYASDNDISYFTTALASSRWKDLAQTDEAGAIAEKSRRGIKYWKRNWRKGGLSERKAVLNKEFGFYNQKYCGCEFSLQNRREYEKQLKNDNQEK
jgi:predicted adenine nucleotide alpha hydrolase (AANH) superfamily ATPase